MEEHWGEMTLECQLKTFVSIKINKLLQCQTFLFAIVLNVLLLSSHSYVYAGHVDDICPDSHPEGNISLDITVEKESGEPLGNGKLYELGFETGVRLKVNAVAKALGTCEVYYMDFQEGQCYLAATYEREVNHVGMEIKVNSSQTDVTEIFDWSFGRDGSQTIYTSTLDTNDTTGTTGPMGSNVDLPEGTYEVTVWNVVNETPCDEEDLDISRTETVHIGKPPEDEDCKNQGVGNPCNPATGEKFEFVVDYTSPTLHFTRIYRSQYDKAFSLGYGWSSNHHKRLLTSQLNTKYVFDDSGWSEPFVQSGSNWVGEADTVNLLSEDANGFTVSKPNGSSERYDLNGNLLSKTDANQQTTNYSYTTTNLLNQVTGPFGHTLQFTYYPDEKLNQVIDPVGNTITYVYDEIGNLTTVNYQDNTAITYLYEKLDEQKHYLTGIIDENNNRYATYDYSGDKAVLTEHAITTNVSGQEHFDLDYSDWPNSTTYTDAKNVSTKVTLNENLGRTFITEKENLVDNKKLTRLFDTNNNVLQITDEQGRITKHTYNASNQKITTTEAFGTTLARTTSYEYLSSEIDLLTKVITPSVYPGETTERILAYADPNVLLPTYIAETGFQPDGTPTVRAMSMTYTTTGQIKTINGPREDVSDITSYAYYECTTGNECGRLKTITNALARISHKF